MNRSRKRIAFAAFALALTWPLSGLIAASALTYRLLGPHPEPPPPGFSPVRLRTDDGLGIGAWLMPAPNARGSVVLLHGNGSSRGALERDARRLHGLGFHVLPVTLRAHGDSDGRFNDIGYGARQDVVAAVRYVSAFAPRLPVIVYGKSLGSAAALFAAEEMDRPVAAYVLIAPYATLKLAVERRTARYLPPILDRMAYVALLWGSRLVLPDVDRISPAHAAYRVPRGTRVLVVAGADDDRAPPSDARRIEAPLSHGELLIVRGASHEDVCGDTLGPDYDARLGAFLESVAPRRTPSPR